MSVNQFKGFLILLIKIRVIFSFELFMFRSETFVAFRYLTRHAFSRKLCSVYRIAVLSFYFENK